MRTIRAFLNRRTGRSMMLGEVNLPHAQQRAFFGGKAANELQMQFDFIGMQATYLALAREDARPLVKALEQRPPIDETCQWATFLRNHDELTLDKLTRRAAPGGVRRLRAGARDAGLRPRAQAAAADHARRRPAPDPDGVQPDVLPAGHADALLRRGDRHGGGPRRPTAGWRSAPRCSGAPGATAASPPRPPAGWSSAVVPGACGPEHVNVVAQLHDPDSLWSFMRKLISIRRTCPELGWGTWSVVDQPERSVLVQRCAGRRSAVVTVHNLGAEPSPSTCRSTRAATASRRWT